MKLKGSMNNQISVVAVDDHGIVLAGIHSVLEEDAQIKVVGEGTCGRDVIPLVKEHKPDVLLLDMGMPQLEAGSTDNQELSERFEVLTAIEKMTRDFPDTRIVILSMNNEPHLVKGAVEAGAKSYIDKQDIYASRENLALIVKMVHEGGIYFSGRIGKIVSGQDDLPIDLSLRQFVALLVFASDENASYIQLAEKLGIANNTYKNHLAAASAKLSTKKAAGAVLKAIKLGLIPLDLARDPNSYQLYTRLKRDSERDANNRNE